MKRFILFLCVLILFAATFFLHGNPSERADARDIVRRMDELYRAGSSTALMEMEIVTPHWQRTLRIKAWSLGMDKTFLRILEPFARELLAIGAVTLPRNINRHLRK